MFAYLSSRAPFLEVLVLKQPFAGPGERLFDIALTSIDSIEQEQFEEYFVLSMTWSVVVCGEPSLRDSCRSPRCTEAGPLMVMLPNS